MVWTNGVTWETTEDSLLFNWTEYWAGIEVTADELDATGECIDYAGEDDANETGHQAGPHWLNSNA